jgi:hypothetical protein
MIGLIVCYIIAALCRLCLRSSFKQQITSAQYNELVCYLAGCMPAQLSLRTNRRVERFCQYLPLTGRWILRRQQSLHKELKRKQSQLLLD